MKRLLSILFRKVNIVSLVLAVLVLFGCGESVEAAEEPSVKYYGVFESQGVNIPYYYTDVVNRLNYKFQGFEIFLRLSHPVYAISCKESDGDMTMYFITDVRPTGDFYYGDQVFSFVTWTEAQFGDIKYFYFRRNYKNEEYDLNCVDVTSCTTTVNDFVSYYLSNKFDDLLTPPIDFSNYNKADWLWLSDFKASLVDDVIYMTWGDLEGYLLTDQNSYEHRYIEFSALFVDDDAENESDKYFMPEYIQTDLSDYEGTISYDDWQVPEGSRLLYLYAIPYWFYMDIPDGKISRGKMSMITFDADGSSGNPLIKDTDDIYNPLDPDFSNWNAITNFTGNYFNNMQQTFDNTFQNYDASGMDDNTDKLGGGLRRYQGEQDAIIDGVSANIEQFNPGDYLNFSEQIVVAMGMASGWINQFLDVSADFTTVFIVGCIMVVIFVVIGIWRFQ